MSGATRRSAGLLAILVCGLAVLGAWTPDAIGDTAVLPFSDDFSVSNGSPLSGFWTEQRGAIAVIDGHATGTGRGNSNVATLNGIDEANVAVQASVASPAPGHRGGLVTRYGGPLEENFYLGQLQGSGAGLHATIWKNIGGVYTVLTTELISSGSGTLEFETVGPSLKLLFNGQLAAFADDSALSHGSVGMRLGKNATLDDFQASPVTQQPASLPFSDDFSTTSDGSQLSRFWTDRQGNITVINGHATGVGPGDANLSSLNGVSQANVVVAGNVALAAGQDVGLVTRYSGPLASNFYLGQLASAGAGFQATIWKNIGGKYTKLTTGLTIGSGAGTLEFEAVGPSLKVILNGQLLAFVDDSSLVNGSVGIRLSEGATLDDFHADSVVQSAAGLPFSDNFSSPSDASQLSHFWTDQRGNVTVVNGRATGTGTGNINVATLNGVNQVNVAVTGEVALAAGQAGGLVTRYGGPLESNFYLGQLVGTAGGWEASIWKNVGGKYTKLSTGLTAATGAGTLEFEAVGPSLKLIFNGQLLAFADDTALNVGSVGMRLSQNATLDNFQADAVVPLLASPPFSDDFATTSEGSQLSRFWTDQRGNITVVSGKATGIAPGNANLSTLNGLNKDNVTVKGVVALAAGQRVGLVTRYGGPLEANFYLGQLASSGVGFQATIWKNIGGVYTKLSTGLTVESGTGTLEFQTIGSTLTLLLDGNVLATATDTHLASGSVGMRLGQDTAVSSFQAP